LTLVLDQATRLQPKRVLDVGAGFGKWGFLLREALDFMAARLDRSEWSVTIDGVDADLAHSPLHQWVYDSMVEADVLDDPDRWSGYDLVVLGDVIEHFPKAAGERLLEALLSRNRNLIVVTPLHFFEQDLPGRPFERHLSHWTPTDFEPWPYDYDVVGGNTQVVLLAGKGATIPTLADSRVSRRVYGLPGMKSRGAAAHLLKRAGKALLAR
jgi:hypothetical protein